MATEFERLMGHGSVDAQVFRYGTVSIIVPVRNAEPYVSRMIQYIRRNWKETWGALEVIITDDCSQDRTVALSAREADLVLPHKKRVGTGACVRDAMEKSRGDFRLVIEPGRVKMIEKAPVFLEWLKEGFDVAIGNRFTSGDRKCFRGNLTARIARRLADSALAPGITDLRSGFRGFTRRSGKRLYDETILKGLGLDAEIVGLAQRMGMRIREVPMVDQDSGPVIESIKLRTAVELIIDSMKAKSHWAKHRIFKWDKVA